MDHDSTFDHEAFLGKEEAREFESLSPDESRQRLSMLVKKIDNDGDEKVTEGELQTWVQAIQDKYVQKDVDRQWLEFMGDADAQLMSFELYKTRQYGDDFDENAEAVQAEDEDISSNYQKMYKRDLRRWAKADGDSDGNLSKEEFAMFIHPEDSKKMAELTALETIEEMDKDGDGKISLPEYIDDLWPNPEGKDDQPEWVKNEVDLFKNFRDKDDDGLMNVEETIEWITPSDYNPHLAEARHLVHEADTNEDGWLSEEEILQKYDIFVGSQATDFGEALVAHDEF